MQQYSELVRRLDVMQTELSDSQREMETLKTELTKAHLHTQTGH